MNAKQRLVLWRILLCALLLVCAWMLKLDGIWGFVSYFVPYLLIGWDVLYKAGRNILRGQVFDENFLMALATIGALAIGEYPEAVFVLLFYQVGELFQSYAVDKSRRSISELMDIRPDFANIEVDGSLCKVNPEGVPVGTVIVVRPGERIPLDGTIVSGASSVNTSALTGESLPRDASAGDQVISGCVNLSAVLRIRTDKLFEDSTVSRILELVENASDKKARAENFITRFARYYTPAVVICAALLCAIGPLASGDAALEWLNRALIFLVISCPCALVISVPLSFFGGIGGASRHGILVKGGNYLEALSRAETFVFDKTGTLTQGSFQVVAVHPERVLEAQLLEYAALAECFSSHPIALSLRAAHKEPLNHTRVQDVLELPGRGIQAQVDGHFVLVGNARLMDGNQIAHQACELPGTLLHIALDAQYAGHIVIADSSKPGAIEALAQLEQLGVKRTVMLTGDAPESAQAVALQLGIGEAHASLMPADKVRHVERLLGEKSKKGTLCFVGDGINDAPVLSRADVGIAMGALGSDAAIEAADIVLMNDKISDLPRAITIAKKTIRIANQNIAFALSIKALVLLLGALGMANMWEAVFADVGVSVIAILNAMRALRAE